jgi:hypothetical protein
MKRKRNAGAAVPDYASLHPGYRRAAASTSSAGLLVDRQQLVVLFAQDVDDVTAVDAGLEAAVAVDDGQRFNAGKLKIESK